MKREGYGRMKGGFYKRMGRCLVIGLKKRDMLR